MPDIKRVTPAVVNGQVLTIRHPKTRQILPAEGMDVDFSNVDVRTFFMRREAERDVTITASTTPPKAKRSAEPVDTSSSAPASDASASHTKPRKGAEQ